MIGAIAGDIIGSIHEGTGTKTKQFPLFGPGHRFTDDTVLTVAVAESILRGGDLVDIFHEYVRRYPDAGYGGTFIRWARQRSRAPYGSWGNGAAMRVSPVGFAFDSLDEVLHHAERTAAVTHDHPEGIRGAQATAVAIFLARTGHTLAEIRTQIERRFGYDLSMPLDRIRPTYRFDVSCQGSVPPSIRAVLEASDYEQTIRGAISLGGDADTMACIAGGIAEALWGVPAAIDQQARRYLDDRLLGVVEEFEQRYGWLGRAAADVRAPLRDSRWRRSDVCLEQTAGSLATLAEEIYRRVCRTDFAMPGFCAIDGGAGRGAVSARAEMVALAKALGAIHQQRTGSGLTALSAGRFDQQVTTKPHLDGAPARSLLILGYEPTAIDSEIELFDYAQCARDLGITPDRFLTEHNPMFPEGQAVLSRYATRLPCFSPGRYQWIVINNSHTALGSRPPAWQGVLHAATVPHPDERQQRLVNSMSIAPVTSTDGPGLSEDELQGFIDCGVAAVDKRPLEDG